MIASKEILVATSYQGQVNPITHELTATYKKWLDDTLAGLEDHGYRVSNALRDNDFRIEDDPVAAHDYDWSSVHACDVFLGILDENASRGVQTGIGRAEVLGKPILLAHTGSMVLDAYNRSMVKAGAAHEITMPIDYDQLDHILAQ